MLRHFTWNNAQTIMDNHVAVSIYSCKHVISFRHTVAYCTVIFLVKLLPRCRRRQLFGGANVFSRKLRARPPIQIIFRMTSKKGLHVILSTLGANVSKSGNVERHFYLYFQVVCPEFQVFREHFHIFCPDFQGFCPDFRLIKTLGGWLASPAPMPPAPLSHCTFGSLLCLLLWLFLLSSVKSAAGIIIFSIRFRAPCAGCFHPDRIFRFHLSV